MDDEPDWNADLPRSRPGDRVCECDQPAWRNAWGLLLFVEQCKKGWHRDSLVLDTYGDGNATVTNGRRLAYDPEDLVSNADGSKTLRVLWDSQQWNIQYLFNKFLPPAVWNGRVYLPNYNGGVDVYALAP
jgi:hypothetical protein